MRVIVTLAAAFCLGSGLAAAATSGSPASAAAKALPATASLPMVDVAFEKFRLANGLTVIVHEDHKAPLVSVNVWYHIGSKDEPEGRHGFAHLFEHLMFNGSEHFNDEFFRALEPAGATGINGTTNRDRTNYFETVPKAALDLALFLESDRMGHLLGALDQAKLDEQRGVVLNEKRQGENQPYGSLREILSRDSFPPGHPYSWTTIGSEADLNAATLDDVKAWFKRYYGPNNAVLVIAGDITVAEARAKAEQYFGAIPAGEPVVHAKHWVAPIAGAVVGGFLVHWVGIGAAFVFNAASYLLVAAVLARTTLVSEITTDTAETAAGLFLFVEGGLQLFLGQQLLLHQNFAQPDFFRTAHRVFAQNDEG